MAWDPALNNPTSTNAVSAAQQGEKPAEVVRVSEWWRLDMAGYDSFSGASGEFYLLWNGTETNQWASFWNEAYSPWSGSSDTNWWFTNDASGYVIENCGAGATNRVTGTNGIFYSFTSTFVFNIGVVGYVDLAMPITDWLKGNWAEAGWADTLWVEQKKSADTRVVLRTGGRSLSRQQNLFMVTETLTDLTEGASPPPPLAQVYIPGFQKNLGADGKVYAALADDDEVPLTPSAPAGYYSFTADKQKYTPVIKANDIPLDPDQVVADAEFCVGQKVTFKLEWPSTPPGLTSESGWDWRTSAKFVNQLSSTLGVPPGLNPDLLKVATPTNWWVSGGNKNARLDETLTFANGQTAKISARGKFKIFRPQKVDFYTATNTRIVLDTNNLSDIWLGIADKDSTAGDMEWTATIAFDQIRFHGTVSYVQLINRAVSYDIWWYGLSLTKHTGSTDGESWLDGSNPYGAVGYIYGDDFEIEQRLTDAPGISGPFYTFADVTDTFNDYVCFQPDGGIPVTIGRVDWGWHGRAENAAGVWSLTTSNLTNATFYQDDTFPQWNHVYHNSPIYQ